MQAVLTYESPSTVYALNHERELTRLMGQYERPLYNFVLAMVRDTDLALDCVQDTFLRAYEALKADKSINTAWLYTVARNRAMDEFRRKRFMHPDRDALEAVPVRHSLDDGVTVQTVLARMPATDREVLYLFVVAGFKTDEIGAMLGMRGTAIRQRLYRARERFRVLYAPVE